MSVPENRYALWEYFDDFEGAGTFATSAGAGDRWVVTDTSASGAPTYERVDHSETAGTYANGVARLKFANTNEVENLCLSFGDKLCFDIDKIYGFETRLRFVAETGSAKDATTTFAFGLTGDRNDAIASIAKRFVFRLAAGTTSMAVTLETDDGTTDSGSIATTLTMTDLEWYRFRILLTSGTDDVRFYGISANTNPSASLTRLASATTFDADQFTGAVQPFFQIQKTADTNIDGVEIDYVQLWGPR